MAAKEKRNWKNKYCNVYESFMCSVSYYSKLYYLVILFSFSLVSTCLLHGVGLQVTSKVVSATFLLVCFLCLKESFYETRKNVFYFTSKTLFVNQILTFQISKCHDVIKCLNNKIKIFVKKHYEK